MKTATVIKLHQAQELLKTAHETLTDAIVADKDFATFAMENPNDRTVTMLITALLKANSAGKKLEELLEQYD